MTKEQAIEWLKSLNYCDGEETQEVAQAIDMAIKALEIVEEFEKAQIITGGRLNGRTYAYKCGLEDGKRKALEQHTSDDVMAIHTQGLDEGIRCAMCTNSMKSDTGCDGGCRVDEDMYKKVMDTIKNHIFKQPTSDDSVSRAEITYELNRLGRNAFKDDTDYDNFFAFVDSLPPVKPTHKVGKWIYHFERDDYNDYENEYYECPFCHDLGGDKYYHYCPVCGNKVKGVEDGSN